jgi:glycosyltransferase involved in cell wall biosynthesis
MPKMFQGGTMVENRSRVSIGMPVFNGDNYLAGALDSILRQTYSDFELIISDNASTDRTGEICREYASSDARIRYVRNEANLGAARNYNRVFALSSGKYFKWASHDDLCAPEFLERCVEVLDREASVVLSYSRTSIIDEHGKPIRTYCDDFNLNSPLPHERFHRVFAANRMLNPIAGVVRSETLKRTRLIANYAGSDAVLLAELALRGEFHEVPECLFYRRVHPQKSTLANGSDEELAAWYDPSSAGRILIPRWRRFFGFLTSVKHAPLRRYDRARCYAALGQFYLQPKRWGRARLDLTQAARTISHNFLKH